MVHLNTEKKKTQLLDIQFSLSAWTSVHDCLHSYQHLYSVFGHIIYRIAWSYLLYISGSESDYHLQNGVFSMTADGEYVAEL